MISAEEVIRRLGLKPHPEEGGFYRETYRADEIVAGSALPSRYVGQRAWGTAIYYLLTTDTFSALHRLKSDEIYHFYAGDPVRMLQLHPGGEGRIVQIGVDLERGLEPQVLAPRGVWQGSQLAPGGRWALLGATVSPGFEFADYEAGSREALEREYPAFRELIRALTP